MRFFRVLIVVALLLILAIGFSEDLTESHEGVTRATANYDMTELKLKYGDSRDFNHSQTRRLYLDILKEVEQAVKSLDVDRGEDERAMVCSVMRANARKYARLRDSMVISGLLLQVRDSYVHALRFLPIAARKDVRAILQSGRPTLKNTLMTIKQSFVCLAPHLSDSECPSYTFLKEVRGKSDGDILQSCTTSNRGYDRELGNQ